MGITIPNYNDMKTKLFYFLSCLLLLGAFQAQTQTVTADSLSSFNQLYERSCVLTSRDTWSTSQGVRPLGWRWRRVASEFDVSPEGKAVFEQSRQQSRKALVCYLAGTALILGILPIVATSPPSEQFDARAGVISGMVIGGSVSLGYSVRNLRKALNNQELALWLRNRDALAVELPMNLRANFKQIYNQETIYLQGIGRLTERYVRNGQRYPIGIFGGRIKHEFQGSADGMVSFKRYQSVKRAGFVVYALGGASTIASIFIDQNNHKRPLFTPAYLAGLVGMSVGAGVMGVATNDLRNAIYLRNRDTVRPLLMLR